MTIRAISLFAVVSLMAFSAASAPPTGSNITPNTPLSRSEQWSGDFSTKEIRELVYGYARCVVDRRSAKASEGLLRNVDNRTLIREYPSLIDSNCLSDQKRIWNDQRRGTVRMSFEGAVGRESGAPSSISPGGF